MAEDAAMRDVFVSMMGGKRRRLERERCHNQQQYRKRPHVMAAELHKRLHYTSRFGGAKPILALTGNKRRMRGFRTTIVSYDAPAPKVVTEFSKTAGGSKSRRGFPVEMRTHEGVAGGRGFADLSPCVSGRQ
jgi:hypothetical protein